MLPVFSEKTVKTILREKHPENSKTSENAEDNEVMDMGPEKMTKGHGKL